MTTTLTATGITFNDATSQTTTGVEIPAGTLMLFVQSTAPTGWTKSTAHNDKALRVVSGSVSSGGSVAFSTAMASQTPTITLSGLSAGATTLSTAQMPSHSHTYSGVVNYYTGLGGSPVFDGAFYLNNGSTGSTGGGGSHSHSVSGSASSSAINLAVQYVDVIICTKN